MNIDGIIKITPLVKPSRLTWIIFCLATTVFFLTPGKEIFSLLTIAILFVLYLFYLKINWGKQIKQKIVLIFIIFFLLVVFIQALNFLSPSHLITKLLLAFDQIKNQIFILITILGIFVVYSNKNKIDDFVEEENEEKLQENLRNKEFSQKFPLINKIPVLKNIINWFYQNGYLYSSSIIILLLAGFIIRIWNLGKLSLWWDELNTGTFVSRIMETGLPLFSSELGYYWRGVAYHYFVSIFAFLFDATEFWIRFPSVIFGMGIIILIYFYAKKINKFVAIYILLFLVFSSYNIEYSRFARFYIMNAFLFVLSIITFYKGFFENKLKYKIYSTIIFLIMMHTVQVGAVFLSLSGGWALYFIKDFINNKNKYLSFIKNKLVDITFMFIFLMIYYLDNIFDRLFKIKVPYERALDTGLVLPPKISEFIGWPQWRLFIFFNENYVPFSLILISLIMIIILFLNKNNKQKFFAFTGISLFIAIILYEIIAGNVYGPRLYFFAEALIIFVVFNSTYLTLRLCLNKKITYMLLGVITFLLLAVIHPYFFHRISIKYGEQLADDPFKTINVATYRSDYKTTNEFVKKNKADRDIIINVGTLPNYYYLGQTNDYILYQNSNWNTGALIDDNGNFISRTTKSIIINSADNITEIIKNNPTKRVWLIVNGGSINILATTHVKKDFLEFLEQNKNKTVYQSNDKISRVLLFNN